jgi:hypothetical protein
VTWAGTSCPATGVEGAGESPLSEKAVEEPAWEGAGEERCCCWGLKEAEREWA